jgi:hypothetical protein
MNRCVQVDCPSCCPAHHMMRHLRSGANVFGGACVS